MGKNKDNNGIQQGALEHSPGQQGEKTRSRQAEIAQTSRDTGETGPQYDPAEIRKHDDTGKDRLFEGREQHDDAESASEKTRRARDIERHDHEPDEELSQPDLPSFGKRES